MIENDYRTAAHAQTTGEDLIVMFKNVPNNPTITKFTLNDTTGYNEICPSRKCNIELGTPSVSVPNPDQQYMGYILAFNVIDKMPQNDTEPIKKKFLEKFSSNLFACSIDKIVEDNNQELYYCNQINTVVRQFDSKTWRYDVTGIYNATAGTMTFTGSLLNP